MSLFWEGHFLKQHRFIISVLKVGSSKSVLWDSKCCPGCVPSGSSREDFISCSFQLVEAVCIPWLVASTSFFETQHSSLSFHNHIITSCSVKITSLSVTLNLLPPDKDPHYVGSTWINQEKSSNLKILNLVESIFTDFKGWNVDIWLGERGAVLSQLPIPSMESFTGYRIIYMEEAKTKKKKKRAQNNLETLECLARWLIQLLVSQTQRLKNIFVKDIIYNINYKPCSHLTKDCSKPLWGKWQWVLDVRFPVWHIRSLECGRRHFIIKTSKKLNKLKS